MTGEVLRPRSQEEDLDAAGGQQGHAGACWHNCSYLSPHQTAATLQEQKLLLPFRLQTLTRVALSVNSNLEPFKDKDSGKRSPSLAKLTQLSTDQLTY